MSNTAPTLPPFVSVIIPAFNAATHIAGALQSVFAQSFTNYEVILINDGSSDTEQLELVIQPYLSQIIYLKQENRGPGAARNSGIRCARGEWLAFLDSDDAWFPQYLAEQMRFLSSDPSLDMVYCDGILDGDPKKTGKTYMQLCPSIGPVTFESLLIERTQVLTSGTVVRRQNVIAAGLFDEEIRWSEDHDLWLRISHRGGKIAYQRTALLRRNLRQDSQGSRSVNLFAGEIQTLRKLDREFDLSPGERELLAQKLTKTQAALAYVESKTLLLAGEMQKAYESLNRKALSTSPKARAMRAGLRIAPRLTVVAARLWHRLKSS